MQTILRVLHVDPVLFVSSCGTDVPLCLFLWYWCAGCFWNGALCSVCRSWRGNVPASWLWLQKTAAAVLGVDAVVFLLAMMQFSMQICTHMTAAKDTKRLLADTGCNGSPAHGSVFSPSNFASFGSRKAGAMRTRSPPRMKKMCVPFSNGDALLHLLCDGRASILLYERHSWHVSATISCSVFHIS